jgi:hypothetical protein
MTGKGGATSAPPAINHQRGEALTPSRGESQFGQNPCVEGSWERRDKPAERKE